MIIDLRTQTSPAVIETDICIVGGGTAGVILAKELIGQPFRVSLLESGGREPDPETQSLCIGDNIGFPYFPLDTARARYLGGSSTRWNIPIGRERLGVRLRPFDPIDFEAREWVKYSGWPFDKAHLNPYYARAQELFRIGPPTYEVADWEGPQEQRALSLPSADVKTVIYKFGCRDPLVRDYPKEIEHAPNIATYLHANVLEVETDGTGRTTGLRIAALGGKETRIRAKYYVLAVGGIETPRLLLLSNRRQAGGVGNEHDLVGRFFMEHPHFWSGMLVVPKLEVFQRTGLYNEIHSVNGVAVVGKFALTEQVLRREKLLNQNIQLFVWKVPDPFKGPPRNLPAVESCRTLLAAMKGEKVEDVGAHLKTILCGPDQLAAAAARKVRKRVWGVRKIPVYYFANMMEQVPNPESRVLLGKERDLFGQQRVQLDWRITEQDIQSARRTIEIIGTTLERAGLGRFYRQLRNDQPPSNTEGGYHHMGTTRMHPDPKQGVVDANCRVHSSDNLFIAGASVFPTGGYANPVLTTLALTVRLADHLKKQMAAPVRVTLEEECHVG